MNPKTDLDCKLCDYKKHNKRAGICLIKKGTDNLPVMCVGSWAKDKHYYFDRYIDLFVRAMSKRWEGNINYIDLFSGPGKCIIRQTGEEVDGSPLIALKYKFAKYIFVDKSQESIKALKNRCKSRANFGEITFIQNDCNKAVIKIKKLISKNSLNIAFIDPFGLNFKFESYGKLTEDRRIDLIINFPLGTAIKRNMNKSSYDKAQLDNFLGGKDWKKPNIHNPTTHFINYFKEKLKEIGYQYTGGDIPIKTKKKQVILYYLLFASKNPRGADFWEKIKKYNPYGQQVLF